jgi:hypothetical protein
MNLVNSVILSLKRRIFHHEFKKDGRYPTHEAVPGIESNYGETNVRFIASTYAGDGPNGEVMLVEEKIGYA